MQYLRKNAIRCRAIVLSGKRGSITITEAARILDIERPNLSKVLNGKAELSLGLAYEIERSFGYSGRTLLEMQLNDKWAEFLNTKTNRQNTLILK